MYVAVETVRGSEIGGERPKPELSLNQVAAILGKMTACYAEVAPDGGDSESLEASDVAETLRGVVAAIQQASRSHPEQYGLMRETVGAFQYYLDQAATIHTLNEPVN